MGSGHGTVWEKALPEVAVGVGVDVGADPEQGPADFDAFFRGQQRPLLAFLRRRTGNDQDAQDLLQESYLRMVRYGYVDPPRPVPVWRSLLYRTAGSLASNLGREHRLHHAAGHEPVEETELVSEQPSPERQAEVGQDLARMLAVLRELPPRCRQVFILHRLHGRSYPEIAVHCGISVKAVEKQVSKALAAFRQRVGDGGRPGV